MRRRPKYQVFISSTYSDLHDEREAVVWKILMARHIPVGMENFTAANERGWKTITRLLDETDYYVLIIAGRYGSIDAASGKSWTQKEYEYARDAGIPVLAFFRRPEHITADKQEETDARRGLLSHFVSQVRASHLCKDWDTKETLGGLVAESVHNHILDDEDGSPRPGWFRGDHAVSAQVTEELARLSSENATLRQKVDSLSAAQPALVFDVPDVYLPEGFQYVDGHFFVKFGVTNEGQTAARDLTIDVAIHGVDGADIYSPERAVSTELQYSLHAIPRIPPKWITDTTEMVYIDTWGLDSDIATFRQRMKYIAPHVTERVVRMGFHCASNAHAVSLQITITDINGNQWSHVTQLDLAAERFADSTES